MQTELGNATLLKRMHWIVQCNSLLTCRHRTVSCNCAMRNRKWVTTETCQTKPHQNVSFIYGSQLFCTKILVSALYGAHFISAQQRAGTGPVSHHIKVCHTLSNHTVGFWQTRETPTPKDHRRDHWHFPQPANSSVFGSVLCNGKYVQQRLRSSLWLVS